MSWRVVAAALIATSFGCGAAVIPPAPPPMVSPNDVVLSLQDLTCQSCGETILQQMRQRPGVAKVSFDRVHAEVHVRFDAAQVLPGQLVREIGAAGFKAVIGAGKGSYLPPHAFGEGADVQWLTRDGSDIDLDAARVAGKVTVVDFGASWCGPCRDVDREMAMVLRTSPDVALRKVDVVDWDSPVAKRHLAGVPSLPYVIVFGRSGARVDAIAGLDLPRLRLAIQQARLP